MPDVLLESQLPGRTYRGKVRDTYELGDNTDRALLQQISTGAAQEMMQLLLAAKAGN